MFFSMNLVCICCYTNSLSTVHLAVSTGSVSLTKNRIKGTMEKKKANSSEAATNHDYHLADVAELSNGQHDADARRQERYECVRKNTRMVYE